MNKEVNVFMQFKSLTVIMLITILALPFWVVRDLGAKPARSTNTIDVDVRPAIAVEEHTYNFGSVVEGSRISHRYTVTNKGNTTLYIRDIKTSCGCTSTEFSREIGPGLRGAITVTFDASGFFGAVEKTVYVVTNDPEYPLFDLRIMGNVEKFVDIFPERVVLKGNTDDTVQGIVSITKLDKYPFSINNIVVQADNSHVSFALKKQEKGYDLIVTNQSKRPCRYMEKIILKTDNPLKPEIVITVRGIITEKNS